MVHKWAAGAAVGAAGVSVGAAGVSAGAAGVSVGADSVAAGAATCGVEGAEGVGGGDSAPSSCKRVQPCVGDAVAGEHSAFLFFMALICRGVESTKTLCFGEGCGGVAATAA